MIFHLAWLSLLRRPARHVLLLLLIALAAALPVFIIQLTSGLYNGINRAVEPFPILAGAKGSQYQLVLNTVFLRDKPIGNIPYSEVDKLRASGRASLVIPLAFGDNYRGFRIVGTEPAIFDYVQNRKHGPWLAVAEGKPFEAEGDAVIGSETARLTGLKIGDTFRSVHGLAGNGKGRAHEHPYKVTGILSPVGGPYDTAIIINIHDVWEAHGGGKADHEDAAGAAGETVRKGGIIRKSAVPKVKKDAEPEASHHLQDNEKGDVTAILIQPKGYADAMKLLAAYQNNGKSDVQMVFPAQSVIALYSMVGQSRTFWEAITMGLMAAAVLITLLVMYWSGLARMKEFALIRALGASSTYIQRLMMTENAILLTAGVILGWLAAWGAALITAHMAAKTAAIVMTTTPEPISFLPPVIILITGAAAGFLPAWLVRKKDISQYL